ncbi:MAG: PAS domain S-box protein, partial [Gammaproteobacteria bacterium]
MQEQDEEKLLREVALQNAKSVLLARQRAEEELVRAKEALEHKTQELAHSLAMMWQSEQRFRSLVAATTSIVWTVDQVGRFVTKQPSWAAYTGQAWDEYRDLGWANALHPDDRDRVRS